MSISLMDKKLQQIMEKLSHTIDFTSRLLKFANEAEILVFKKLLENRLQAIFNYNPDVSSISQHGIEFVPNLQAARMSLVNTFGYVRQSQELPNFGKSVLPPISRPLIPGSISNGGQPNAQSPVNPMNASLSLSVTNHLLPSLTTGTDTLSQINAAANENAAALVNVYCQSAHAYSDSNLLQSKQYGDSSQSLGPFSTLGTDYNYEKWSNASTELYSQNGSGLTPSVQSMMSAENMYGPMSIPADHSGNSPQVVELNAKLINNPVMFFPPKAQIKRHKMIYHCKFGEFGVMEGQFTEPSGVAVNAQGDIIVADTNNHRIQIFDKEGRFKFQFGECGKRDGQLLYPNRVAVNRVTGDIVVTERSPTHQIQVYNQYGQFLRKFGANVLQHPRGVTVDSKGRIVVVECKVMRVIILDMFGNVLQKFSCSKYLEFPNGVVTNDKQEIFVSDNRAHCVKVFNYDGVYMRQIGGEGLTNYPIGVGINHLGEIIIADNHNNFNLTIFQQDGTLVNALESKVKHAQCFDVALLDDGSIVLSSKDYRLYIYRYVQVPPMFM
ncbi:unnamed protein product [Soboliphyme baturini]|uniref:Brain tumor protein n=1 Tax=Soboliphyme baturini TaxID=241478 RepID=A0A183J683_9BILA|nr:unnamed protein product [Soboliphyme baturini]